MSQSDTPLATPTFGRRAGIPKDAFPLTEAYSQKGFLSKFKDLKPSENITVADICTASKLVTSMKGGSTACITYEQLQYKIGKEEEVRIGRYYPFVGAKKGSVSYQTMRGSLRRILMNSNYAELDMKNA